MKLVTWNVNSVRARKDRLLAWLTANTPDILCVQELKAQQADFPADEVRALGYEVAAAWQKTYNGVAILSRAALGDVRVGLEDGVDDPQARLVAATIDGVRVLSAYFPNGQTVGSDKWHYKLAWIERLSRYLDAHCDPAQPLALCGDFNVAFDDRDVHAPDDWKDGVLYHPEIRAAFEPLRRWGLSDVFRQHNSAAGIYTWWDYQMLGFPKNRGLRIDHVFATASFAARCTGAGVDRNERKGKQPSDHAPMWVTFT